MKKDAFVEYKLDLTDPRGNEFKGLVRIQVGCAMVTFDHPDLAKQMYYTNKMKGRKVLFDDKTKSLVRFYPGMGIETITKCIGMELKTAGGKLVK